MKARTHLSIGEVLSLLQDEFPDITISKIRFLESQGLLDPERTPSGYRKFYDADLHQLRYILIQQRDHFLPLKVIKDRIASGQHLPAPGEDVADLEGVELEGRSGPGPGRNGSDPAGPPAAGLPDGAPEATDGPAGSGAGPIAGADPAAGASPSASAATAASAGAPAAAEAGAPAAGGPTAAMAPAAGAGPGAGSGAAEPPASVPASADVDGSEANGLTAGGVDPAAWTPESTGPISDSAGRERPGTAAGAGMATAGAGGTAAGADTPPWASRGTAAGGPGATGAGAGGRGRAERAERAGAAEASGREPVAGPGRAGPEPEAPAIAAAAAAAADRGGAEPTAGGTDPAGSGEVDGAAPGVEAASGAAARRPGAAAGTDRDEGARARRGRATPAAAGERAGTASSPGRGGDLTSASLSLTELAGAAGLDVSELRDLERYGVVSGRRVGADTVYGDDALQAAQVAARFRRHGIEARHLRAYRMAADREIGLFEQVVAPQLRSRRDGPGAGPAETLDELEELGDALRHVLVRQALQGLLEGG